MWGTSVGRRGGRGATRREQLRVLGSAATGALLAACGAPPAMSEQPPAPGEVSAEIYWSVSASSLPLQIQQLFDSFKAKYPKVTVKHTAGDGTDYYAYLIASSAAGTAPDVMHAVTFVVPEHVERSISRPLDEYIKRDRREVNPDDWWPAQVQMINWKGKQYLLPWDFSNLGLVVNKSVFQQSGVAMPSDEKWTWEEVATLAQRLSREEAGVRTQWGLLNVPPVNIWQAYGFIAAAGGQIVSSDLKRSTWNSPQIVKLLQFFADQRLKTRITPRPSDVPAGVNLFTTGRAAMDTMGSWETITRRTDVGSNFDWDVLRYPLGSTGKRTVSAAGAGEGVSKGSRYPEAAWQWAKHYTSTESLNITISDLVRSIPARKASVPRWQQVASSGGLPPKNVGAFAQMMTDAFPMPNLPYYQEVQSLIAAPLNGILNDGAPVESTLASLDQQINAIIARYSW
jgi:multiple sugar transport system substrate-binding protein